MPFKKMTWVIVVLFFSIFGCATNLSHKISIKEICIPQGIKHLSNPRFSQREYLAAPFLINRFRQTKIGMQKCYQDLYERIGEIEFKTCFMAGYDSDGNRDVFHFSSKDVQVDEQFISCGKIVLDLFFIRNLVKNAFIIHSYHFYVSEK